MKALHELPDGYRAILSIDLQKDKKLALLINLAALLIGAVMIVAMLPVRPITALLDMTQGLTLYFIRIGVMVVSLLAYIVLHEAVHGIVMKAYGTRRVRFGFTGLYAFAASDDHYTKGAYIAISLAPILVWGVVLAVLCAVVPVTWFWVVYFVQVCNVAGAAGDIYVTVRFCRLPKTILVQDNGVSMTVYARD